MLDPLLGPGDFLLNVSVEVLEHRAGRAVPAKGRALSRHLHRAVAGRLHRSLAHALAALQLRAAREGAGAAQASAGRADRGADARRQSRPGLASRQGGAADRRRATPASTTAVPASRAAWGALAERLGIKVIHVAERDTQVSPIPKRRGEFVNTWSIDGFVGEGCQPAELGWGSHERHFPPDGAAPRLRQRRGDLPAAARRLDAGAHLDAARRPVPRLPHHPQRGDLDRRLFHACATAMPCATARPCITPITPATARCSRCMSSPARTGSMQPSKRLIDGRDHPRHRRAGRAADGPCQGRLLVRLAARHRRGARAWRPTTTRPACR